MTDYFYERRVVCAANRIIGPDKSEHLLIGARHWDKMMSAQLKVLKELWEADGWQTATGSLYKHNITIDQGFIDQHGVYMDREEACKVAEESGRRMFITGSKETLFSEDMY